MRFVGYLLGAVQLLGVVPSSLADDEGAAGAPRSVETTLATAEIDWNPRTLSASLSTVATGLAEDAAMSERVVEALILDGDRRAARLGVLVALSRGDDIELLSRPRIERRVEELGSEAAAEGQTAFAWELAALCGPRAVCAHLGMAECPEVVILTTNCPDLDGQGGGRHRSFPKRSSEPSTSSA